MKRQRSVAFFLWPLLAVAAVLAFSQSAYFTVRQIDVRGLHTMGREEVLNAAGVYPPLNVFVANPRTIQARLEAYPLVAAATVRRRLPAGLAIIVRERTPVGALPYGQHLLLFDSFGVPFAIRKDQPVPPVPLVTGTKPTAIVLGRPVPDGDVKLAAGVVSTFPAVLTAQVAKVDFADVHNIILQLNDGVQVNLGDAGSMPQKVGLLAAMLRQVAAKGWQLGYVDLQAPSDPVVRLRQPGTSPSSPTAVPLVPNAKVGSSQAQGGRPDAKQLAAGVRKGGHQ